MYKTLFKVILLSLAYCVVSSISYADSESPDSVEAKLVDAAEQGRIDDIKRLLAGGANIDGRYYKSTPLLGAINKKQKETVKFLLDAGANPDLPDWGGAPLVAAIEVSDDPEIVAMLIAHGANPDQEFGDSRNRRSPLIELAESPPYTKKHQEAIMNGLKQAGAEIRMGSKQNQERIAKLLIAAGAKFELEDNDCDSPLNEAISKNNVALAKIFLESGANPNTVAGSSCAGPGETPLQLAIFQYFTYKDTAIIALLLDHGANVNFRIDKEFIDGPPFFTGTKWDGITPLLSAVASNFVAIAKMLLDHGADPCLTRTDGKLPIEIAMQNKYRPMILLLSKHMRGRECENFLKKQR